MAKKGYVSVSISYRLYGPGCSAAGGNQGGCVQANIDRRPATASALHDSPNARDIPDASRTRSLAP